MNSFFIPSSSSSSLISLYTLLKRMSGNFVYNLDFKRKIWTWTGIWTSDLQITSLALLQIEQVQIFLLESKL